MLRDHPQLEPVLLNDARRRSAQRASWCCILWSGRGGEQAPGLAGAAAQHAGCRWPVRRGARGLGSLQPGARRARMSWSIRSSTGQALPPFGWTLASGPAGVAEPRRRRPAAHPLLRPGQSGAGQPAADAEARAATGCRCRSAGLRRRRSRWPGRFAACRRPAKSHRSTWLGARAGGMLAMHFNVPSAGCAAQRLELAGTAPEFPNRPSHHQPSFASSGGGR